MSFCMSIVLLMIAGAPWIFDITLACPSPCTCTSDVVDCTYKGLSSIPKGIPSTTTDLWLNDNNITTIPDGAFTGLSNLRRLNLDDNQITEILDGAFTGLSNLKQLNLDGNQITTIPDGAFTGLRKLTFLWLRGNQITTITDGVFTGLSNIELLWLNDNQITEILDGAFTGLSTLQGLWLNDNQITTITDGAFTELSNLRELNLRGNQITTITDGVFTGLSNLQYLWLNDNQITTITDGAFTGLSNLQYLTLYDNPDLPLSKDDLLRYGICGEVADGLRLNLYVVDLGTTYDTSHLSTCPDLCKDVTCSAKSSCHEVGVCSLGKCSDPLKPQDTPCDDDNDETDNDVCDGAGSCSGVVCPSECSCSFDQVVDCSSQNLTEIPADIPSTTKELKLNNNDIFSIPNDAFVGLTSLRKLWLNDNQITTIPDSVFSRLTDLQELWLGDNQITTIRDGAFTGLSNLQRLYLRGNNITTIPVGVFSGMSKLQYLWLGDNQITTIPDGAFTGLSNLQYLWLYGNPDLPLQKDDLLRYGICGQVAEGLGSLKVADKDTTFDNSLLSTCPSCENVICVAASQCHDVGTCNAYNGKCTHPFKEKGTACDDGNNATHNDACDGSGKCEGNKAEDSETGGSFPVAAVAGVVVGLLLFAVVAVAVYRRWRGTGGIGVNRKTNSPFYHPSLHHKGVGEMIELDEECRRRINISMAPLAGPHVAAMPTKEDLLPHNVESRTCDEVKVGASFSGERGPERDNASSALYDGGVYKSGLSKKKRGGLPPNLPPRGGGGEDALLNAGEGDDLGIMYLDVHGSSEQLAVAPGNVLNDDYYYHVVQPIYLEMHELVVDPCDVSLGPVLGQGAFGVVHKGELRTTQTTQMEPVVVAVKVLKSEGSTAEFLAESKMVMKLDHPNIVRLLATTSEAPLMLVMEFMPFGSLLSYLKGERPNYNYAPNEYVYADGDTALGDGGYAESSDISGVDMLRWAQQVVEGMLYLEQNKIIHCDIAARNILVASHDLVKVSDFGLSRNLNEEYYKLKGIQLPIKWMALESLSQQHFSHKTDVWMTACLFYEIWTRGSAPMHELVNRDVLSFLKRGKRPQQPMTVSDELYAIMTRCWATKPSDRPDFGELKKLLSSITVDQ